MASVQEVITPITITNYERDFVDGVTQHNPVFAMLKKHGNIKKNVGGTGLTWQLEAGRHDVHILTDYEDNTAKYTPRKRFAQATLGWGLVGSFRAISKGQLRQNSGQEALVRFRDEEIPAMFRDLIDASNGLGHQFLNEAGTSAGSPHFGLPALNGTVSFSAGAKEGTVTAGTYAGLNLAPSGINVDGVEADAWTPKHVNTTSTAWSGGAGNATFRYNAFEVLTYSLSVSTRFGSKNPDLMPDCWLLTRDMFNDVAYQIQAKETIFISGKAKKGEQFGIGTAQHELTHNGYPIYWDENMPASTGWLLNFKQIDLCVQPLLEVSGDKSPMKKGGEDISLFECEVSYNTPRGAVDVSVVHPGQFRFRSPRYQTRLYAGA